jgi:hypothetical protein
MSPKSDPAFRLIKSIPKSVRRTPWKSYLRIAVFPTTLNGVRLEKPTNP